MGFRNFIDSVVEILDIDGFTVSKKKKALKELLKKLENREEKLHKKLKKDLKKKEKKAIKDELSLVEAQIKKGEKILNNLENK